MADDYLKPYEEAVKAGGTGFESLLWRNKEFQLVRFRVLCEVAAAGLQRPDVPASLDKLSGRVIADMGSGRADLCEWLIAHEVEYGKYIGVEGIGDLADVCRQRITDEKFAEAAVVQSDFAADPLIFESLAKNHGAELFLFSGSLNTFEPDHAFEVITRAYGALQAAGTSGGVVFNFLSDLVRDPPSADTGPAKRFDTLDFVRKLSKISSRVALRHDYLSGHDATIGVFL